MTAGTPAAAENLVDRNEILPLLGPVKRAGEWLMAYCPAHADGEKHHGTAGQSLGLSNTGVLRCFAGCDFKSVITALRARNPQPSPVSIRKEPTERLVKIYQYRNRNGDVVAEKGRFEGANRKSFRWRLPGQEGWPPSGGLIRMSEMPLYGAHLLPENQSEPVYFVEGEKACEACWDQGLLAVTHGGGAGLRDFGETLEPLRGRAVYLWPDNDAPGAEYMAFVRAKLALMGCDIKLVAVQVPPKGDAYDYFATGHTIDQISAASPTAPVVTVTAEDAVKITAPTEAGPVVFSFDHMDKKRRQFDAEVTISCFSDPEPYTQQLNLNAHSSITDLRRDLNEVFGKEYNWTRLLNRVFGLAREAYLTQDRGKDLADVPDVMGEMFLIEPLVMADGPTIFFGDGSSLKSYASLKVAYCLSQGMDFCGMSTPELTPLVIDYEDSESNYRRRLKRIARGMGDDYGDPRGVHYWPGKGIPLVDQVEAIKRYCDRHGVGILIVDSVAPACGGDPLDPQAVLTFFSALKWIGLPSILIAHVTKGGDTMKPFGTVYWHNEARRTWFVMRVQDEESDDVDVSFHCRKVNDGRMPRPIAFNVHFSEDMHGPVTIDLGSMERAPPEILAQTSAKNQVWVALSGLPRSTKDIADETGLSLKAVQRELERGPFVRAGLEEAHGKGRPAQKWARQAILDNVSINPVQNVQKPNKGFLDTNSFLGDVQKSKNLPDTKEGVPGCWKCGKEMTNYDGEWRPCCEEHRTSV